MPNYHYNLILGVLLCLLNPAAWAQEDIHNPTTCPQDASEKGDNWLDRTHYYLSKNVCDLAIRFDSFFEDERVEAEDADRYIRVRLGLQWRESGDISNKTRVRARFKLPHLKERLNLVLSHEEEDNIAQLRPDATVPATTLESSEKVRNYTVALRWQPFYRPDSSFSTSAGVHFGRPLEPYVRGRYRYTHGLGDNMLVRLTESVFWKNQEGFGETTRFDWERRLMNQDLLRWSTFATLSESIDGAEWGSGVTWFHTISMKKALAADLSMFAETRPEAQVNDYTFSVRYRQNVYRPWLFFEVEPAISHLREEDTNEWRTVWGVTLQVEALFGQKRGGDLF